VVGDHRFGEVLVADPVRVRWLTDQDGLRLQQIVRRGSTNSVRYRRAMMLLAWAGGNRVLVIVELVAADEDTVRGVFHRFNQVRLACLDSQWAGGSRRLPMVRRWAKNNKAKLCFTPTQRLLDQPDRDTLPAVAAVHPRQL
jgi:hypothetical protein